MFTNNLQRYQKISSSVLMCFVKMTKEEDNRKIIITKYLENVHKSVGLIAKELKFPKTTVYNVIKRYKQTLVVTRQPGSGRKCGWANTKQANRIVRTVERKPTSTVRELGVKFGVSKSLVQKILTARNLRAFRVQKSTNRTDQQAARAKSRSRKLYDKFLRGQKRCVVMDDETYVVLDFQQLPGRGYYRATRRFGVTRKYKYQSLSKFPTKLMIWQAICSCGRKSKTYIAKGTMKSQDYVQECLKKRVLPFLRSHDIAPLFWPDLASIHYSKCVLDWYNSNEVNFVPVSCNPPNCPQLRPIERYWAFVKRILKKGRKVAKNATSFQKFWLAATKQVSEASVKRLMANLAAKVNKFSRLDVTEQV